jgi:RNA polymerase sigma-70 factor (ECF subfamily)
MTSEAAAYFPDALSTTSEDRGTAQGVAAIASDPPDKVRPYSSEASANTVIPIAEITDELLLEQVGTGDRDALSQLFRRHAHTIRNVARRILRHEAEADDLVQDVFIFLFRKAALFKAMHGSARSWIVQVTYHRAFNRRSYLKTRHFYTNRDLEQVMLTAVQRQAEVHFVKWSLEGVWGKETAASLRQILSASQLATIELHFFEGYTLGEIADRLGQPLGNVRHHYYRGLEKLRRPAFAGKLRSK